MRSAVKLTVTPGTVVADRFAIRHFIAEGGMGEVYAARDLILEEDIAVKFLSRRNIGDENVIRRFHREIQLARKVTHPNVCRLFDVYRTALELPSASLSVPVTFVTMELLHGPTLEDRLEREGAMTEDEALPIALQMCRALAAAHDAGVIHRDFKSNNVMLDGSGERVRVVVTDFGLARSILPSDPSRTPLTADQVILGTADYMAPEQIKGEPVSHKSDLYALGVVLFEMVTGRKPYEAANPMQLLVKRVSEPPARPRDFRPGLSESWESVILDCLAESPDARPDSALEIIERLGGEQASSGATRLAGAIDEPTAELAAPRRAAGLWLVPTLLLLAALAFWASRRPEPPAAPGLFNPQRLTSAPGLELDAAFSPDGESVVYSAERPDDGTFGLFRVATDGASPPRAVDTGGLAAFEPSFAPGGDSIVFSAAGGDDEAGLWTLPADGSAPPRRLLARGSRPVYAPDGRSIAFQTAPAPLLSDTTAPAAAPSVIARLDLATGEVRALTRPGEPEGGHGQPAFSPDGRHLVFSATARSTGRLWALDLESGALTSLLAEPARAYDPVVAADGRSVYFSYRSLEVKTLWRLEVDPRTFEPRGAPVEIAGLGLSSLRQPTLSRDGRHLLFTAFVTRSNLWRQPVTPDGLAGGPAEAITSGDDRYNRPTFSPDGSHLAFDHWKLGVDIDVFQLALDAAGAAPTQLTRRVGTNSHASWLQDGGLVYTSTAPLADAAAADGRRTLRRVDEPLSASGDGGADTELLTLEPDVDWVVVSPGGERVAFHTRRGGQGLDIWVQELDDAPPWRLTFHELSAGFPVFAPGGDRLAYQVRVGDGTELWLAPLDGGEPRALVREPGESWAYGFAPAGDKILFAGRRGGRWNLYWVEIDGGAVRQLGENPSITGYLRYPIWSPRGDLVVYEKAETIGDLFLVRDFLPGG